MVPRGDDDDVRVAQCVVTVADTGSGRGTGGHVVDAMAVHGYVRAQSAQSGRHLVAEGDTGVIGRGARRCPQNRDPTSEDAPPECIGGEPDDVVPLSEVGRVEIGGVDR